MPGLFDASKSGCDVRNRDEPPRSAILHQRDRSPRRQLQDRDPARSRGRTPSRCSRDKRPINLACLISGRQRTDRTCLSENRRLLRRERLFLEASSEITGSWVRMTYCSIDTGSSERLLKVDLNRFAAVDRFRLDPQQVIARTIGRPRSAPHARPRSPISVLIKFSRTISPDTACETLICDLASRRTLSEDRWRMVQL